MPRTLFHDIDPARVRANLEEVTGEAAGRAEVLVACKYVPVAEMGALVEAGVTLVGENRQQDLAAKHEAYAADFTWDFIGNLQSRKVRQILPLVRLIHSVGTDSALEQLGRHGTPETEVLIEVNVAGEEGKSGLAPSQLPSFVERCPAAVVGLMTMPPFTADPEDSRPHFAALRRLAEAHGLRHLSMGTSQDYVVAASEGATIVRLGTSLFRDED